MDAGSVMVIYSALLGLALGSFLNVCIYRIPLKKSIISPPSSCPSCGERVRFYDNIPLISYLVLLGKCRHCKVPLSLQYPVVEVLTGLLSILLFIRYGLSYQYFLFLVFTSILLTISVIDLHHQIIPDVLSLSGIVMGWAAGFVPGTPVTWVDSLLGTLIGGGSLFLIATAYEWMTGREGMGGGDVKLLAMIGAWMGWRQLHLIVFISSLAGAVVGIFFLLLSGKGFRAKIPFGPFLSLGAVLCLFFGRGLMNWYIHLLQ